MRIPSALIILLLLSGVVFAQQDYIFDSQNRERGYSRTIGGKTYFYDDQGRERGYARTLGDRTYNFDESGREAGYSQTLGERTYIFGDRSSDPLGYFRANESDLPPAKTDKNPEGPVSQQVFDYGQGGYSWGVSGPPPKGEEE